MLHLHIDGQPIPQPRHQIAVRGRKTVAYIPSKHPIHEWRELIRLEYLISSKGIVTDQDEPLVAMAAFHIERPASHFTKSGKLRKGIRAFPTGARDGDADNLMKPMLDVLESEGVFVNDSQVVRLFDVSKEFVEHGQKPFARVCVLTRAEFKELLCRLTPQQIAGNGVLSYV